MKQVFSLVVISLFSSLSFATKYVAVGNPSAPGGGTLYISMTTEPESLNPLSSTDAGGSTIQGYVMDGLLTLNPDTYTFQPGLAERWEEGKNGMSYTFFIRKGVRWHDGKPLTAHDVKFSYDAIMDSKYRAVHAQPYFENIKGATVIDDHTIRFDIKKKYFNNFNVLASGGFLAIVPKHFYKDHKKKLNKVIMGSGPYKVGKYKKGKSITLVKNKDWWGFKVDHLKGYNKPDKIFYRFIQDAQVRIESFKKGKLDYVGLRPEDYVKKAKGKGWGTKFLKKKVENSGPKSYGFIAWNFKEPLFQDRDVRIALAHLMNRDLMNKKFRFGMSLMATGPWYRQSPYADKNVKPFAFDIKKAKKLLKKSGWADTDKNGILDKQMNGKKKEFKFTLLYPNRDSEKYYTLYKEDLKKAGIHMNIKLLDWASFVKSLDERKFEAVSLAWTGGSVDNDPKQIWHSQSSAKGGSNFNSYSNPKVDKLIDKGRAELNKKKRIKIYQEIYRLIAADAPYAFMFVPQFDLYANNSRVKQSKPTFKYSIGTRTWWLEPNK